MVEVRDAATVMLVRDGDAGMEVLMLMRNLNSDFVGGAYVFPGGAVDPHDRHEDLDPVLPRTDRRGSERTARHRERRPRVLGRGGARVLRRGRHPARLQR